MKGKVLIVEDDVATATFMCDALEMQGYEVREASGAQAFDTALTEQPDVVLLNVRMPDVSGVEVSQRLRAHPATAEIPIISISAHTGQKGAPEEMHSDEHLSKPFSLGQLYRAVARRMKAAGRKQ